MTSVHELLGRLAQTERDVCAHEFLSPAVGGGVIGVRIGGVVCQMRTHPRGFAGWGVFRTKNLRQARLVRKASLKERADYLGLFPRASLIVCAREGEHWLGCAACQGDRRFRMEGAAGIELGEELQLFETVRTRFDGQRFWFEAKDARGDPTMPGFLRSSLNDLRPPATLRRSGLTAEQRAAYELNYLRRTAPKNVVSKTSPPAADATRFSTDQAMERLGESLSHAGAELIDYLERGDSFRVSYAIEGRKYTSSVKKGDLTVQVAGICLSGEDQKFDLGSLVGVIRQADGYGDIVAVGPENGGMSERDYWRIHPRRQ